MHLENISNIKNLYASSLSCEIQPPIHYKIICDKILENMIHVDEMNYLNFRDLLYDIFIYHLDITDCIWYILSELVEKNQIKSNDWRKLMLKTYCFFQYYNNNYRPIYHLENYLLTIVQIIHGF
jgi:hypothetical protein